MIKRPLVWIFLSYMTGVILADRHRVLGILITSVLLVLIVFLMIIIKVSNRYINKLDRFLFILPAFMYLGIFLMQNQLNEPYLNKIYEDKVSGWVTGTLYQIEEKDDKEILYMKNNKISILTDNNTKNSSINLLSNSTENTNKKMYVSCEKILIYSDKSNTKYKIGNQIKIYGQINILQHNTNPGQFDEFLYYKTLGIDYKVYADNVTVIDSSFSRYHYILYKIKKRIETSFRSILGKKEAGVLTAMLLGDKSELDADISDLYQENGISHILAISGLHVSLVGLFIYRILRKIHCNIYISIIISILFIYSFGVLTNFSVSTNRAVVMLIVSYIALFIGRTYDIITSLALSALIILIQNPMQIYSVGFLLSFSAVLGIAIFLPIFKDIFESNHEKEMKLVKGKKEEVALPKNKERMNKVFHYIRDGLLMSLSVNVVTTPIILRYFYEFPVYSILINLIIIPLSSILLLLAFTGGIIGCFSVFLGRFFIAGAYYILLFYEFICSIFLKLPFHKILVGKPSGFMLCLYYLIIALIVFMYYHKIQGQQICKKIHHFVHSYNKPISSNEINNKQRNNGYSNNPHNNKLDKSNLHSQNKNKRLLILLMLTLIIFIPQNSKDFTVTFLDVGQGDGIIMRTPNGSTYLIDGGSTTVSQVGKYRIEQYLKYKGVGMIDYAIMTHADQDHVSGLTEMLLDGEIKIKHLIVPNISLKDDAYLEVVSFAEKNSIPVLYIEKGDEIKDGEVILTCLHPDNQFQTTSRNAYSTVISVNYGDFDMLLTGDVEEDGELDMIKSSVLKDYDILKVAHHGSKYSTQSDFLSIVKPEYSIISCGKKNRYGHPHEELLNRLKDMKSKVYTTMDAGAITIQTDGKTVKLYEFANKLQ